MFLTQCIRWLATLALAAATLLMHADDACADAWSLSSNCGCSEQVPAAGWFAPQASSCLSRPFWMRPTPVYDSSWQRVPVTNYRPQVVNDPLSGISVTTLQPCDTYEWQMRRTAGCSLWQSFVKWWQSRCCLLNCPTMSPASMACPPTSQWAATSPAPAASPYYAPSPNGRMVPIPSSESPASPVPADRRPQLDPVSPRTLGEGSASRLLRPDTQVFVSTLDNSDAMLELGPPLVAPRSQAADADVGDDQATSSGETSLELIPVGLSVATPSYESELPTDVVWDDTGWKSEQ